MKRKVKRFMNGCLATLLMLTVLPGQMVFGSEPNILLEDQDVNAENMLEPGKIEDQEEGLWENIMEESLQGNENLADVNNNWENLEQLLGEGEHVQNALLGDDRDASFPMVEVGNYGTAAVKIDGSLWMWGLNNYGQLGDGTTTDRISPVKVMDDVKSVSLLQPGISAAVKAGMENLIHHACF